MKALYRQGMQQISGMKDTDDVDICRQILAITLTTYRPVTLEELGSFIDCPQDVQRNGWQAYYIRLCDSFLTIRDHTICLVHQSAEDFLCSPSLNDDFGKIFPRGVEGMHHTLFSKSLGLLSPLLTRDMYLLSYPGAKTGAFQVPEPDPLALAKYPCVYWVDHLSDAHAGDATTCMHDLKEGGTVHEFLRDKFLYWLEALSLIRNMPKGVAAIEKLHRLLQVRLHRPGHPLIAN